MPKCSQNAADSQPDKVLFTPFMMHIIFKSSALKNRAQKESNGAFTMVCD